MSKISKPKLDMFPIGIDPADNESSFLKQYERNMQRAINNSSSDDQFGNDKIRVNLIHGIRGVYAEYQITRMFLKHYAEGTLHEAENFAKCISLQEKKSLTLENINNYLLLFINEPKLAINNIKLFSYTKDMVKLR